ncbi:MAG: hypothetical protein ACJAWL_002631 [Motiliproteus sp.]|jgi:hypothetical protein
MIAKWVTVKQCSTLYGYSENAIRAYIKKGVWRVKLHWIKAPNGRVMINPESVNKWIEGTLV